MIKAKDNKDGIEKVHKVILNSVYGVISNTINKDLENLRRHKNFTYA